MYCAVKRLHTLGRRSVCYWQKVDRHRKAVLKEQQHYERHYADAEVLSVHSCHPVEGYYARWMIMTMTVMTGKKTERLLRLLLVRW